MASFQGQVYNAPARTEAAQRGAAARFRVIYAEDPAVVVYYLVRGYYTTGSVYETWVTTDLNATPPSGHSLIDIAIISQWSY